MKQYFVKLIQAEGDIKVGDYVKEGLSPSFHRVMEHSDIAFINSKNSPFQKFKAFICSRDIQVGDKIYVYYDSKSHRWNNGFYFVTSVKDRIEAYKEGTPKDNISSIHKDNPIKIVGEISPDAIWVKEGDEFNEDELEKTDEFSGLYHSVYKGERLQRYKIKGPCGHFH